MSTMHRIDELRESKKISQTELCKFIGVSKGVYSDWMSGRIKSYTKYLDKIAECLSVSTDYLLGKETINMNSLSEQEKAFLSMFRSTTENGRLRMIQSVMNIYDEIEKKQSEAV